MSSIFYKLVLFMAVLFLLFLKGESIKCYQCNSYSDEGCDTLDGNSTMYLKKCDGNYNGSEPFCRKTKLTIIDVETMVRVIRTCGWLPDKLANPCYSVPDSDFHLETVCICREDGCNSAPITKNIALGTIITLFIVKLIL